MQKVAIFYNKFAAGANDYWIQEVKRILFRSELHFFPIPSPYRLKKQMGDLAVKKFTVVICIGGDGSMNRLIQELVERPFKFMLIPAGTANDLAHELGVIQRLQESLFAIRRGSTKKIDLVNINSKLFATNGGIGLGAEVTGQLNILRQRFAATTWLLKIFKHRIYSLLLAYFSLHPQLPYYTLKISSTAFNGEVRTPFLFILNQTTVAGDIELVTDAHNSDGQFHVVIFTHPKRWQLINVLGQIVLGKIPQDDPHYISFCVDELQLEVIDATAIEFFGDGEILGKSRKIHVKIVPKALEVFVIKG